MPKRSWRRTRQTLELRGLLGDVVWRKRIAERRRVAEEKRAVYDEKARTIAQARCLTGGSGSFREEWFSGAMSLQEKRSLLGALIQWVFVRGNGTQGASAGRVRIVWATDPPVDIPKQRRPGWVPTPFPSTTRTENVMPGLRSRR